MLQLHVQTGDPFRPETVGHHALSRKMKVRFHDSARMSDLEIEAEAYRMAQELRAEADVTPEFWISLARALLLKVRAAEGSPPG